MSFVVDCARPEDTRALGRGLGQLACPGLAVALLGTLGAGKTVFAKGVGEGLQIAQPIASPTFVLVAVYDVGRLPLWHADLYRLEPGSSVDDLELELANEGVLLVEWADRVPGALPDDHLRVTLSIEGEGRRVHLEATGPRHRAVIEAIRDLSP